MEHAEEHTTDARLTTEQTEDINQSSWNSFLKRRWSSDDLREVKRRTLAGIASSEESALFAFVVGRALPAYCKWRFGREELLRAYLNGWDPHVECVAERAGVTVRTAFVWVSGFLQFAAGFVVQSQQAKHLDDWDVTWCDLTHRESGGDGRTPAMGRENFSARNCPACAERAKHRLTCRDDQCAICRG